ncbi:uncharacterized protein [Nicotiana sylvestris]|uniref:Uncharacterized protein LOC104243164 n=1 Tax=Nicotiana sylvestris TaxID=4096 RepID=A0A1U7YCU9_NICSY|nr:PREDICTED: uncharacterized protein LOC104243164 [Nicotiana sylvestris]
MTTSSLQESYLRLMPNEHLGTSWFQRLREYLSRFEQLNLELVLSIISTTNTFTVEELNEITSFCSPSVVKHLMLKDVAPPLNFESLLDGLFWTCHPESLSVESMWGRSDEFMQFLREKLMEKEGVQPVCCDSRSVKCWRHYLKGIEVENSTTSLHGDSFSPCQVSTICFKLRW